MSIKEIIYEIEAHGHGEKRPVSQQTLRSERTRTALLEAAELIFARDGFEASRIEDIATQAGRSRGAFYANFANKTEVFLELRSRAAARSAREVRALMLKNVGKEARAASLDRYFLKQICDTRTLMLQIEFKLYALRHPGMLAQLAEKHLEASTTIMRQELADVFPEKSDEISEMRRKTLALEALLEGFALNAMFSPSSLSQTYLEEKIPLLLRTLFSNTRDDDR